MKQSLFKEYKKHPIDTVSYLHRIGINENSSVSLKTLSHIHRQHLLSVPFENLDIHYRRRIRIDSDAIVQKIVNEKRGGFCYELNSSLFTLLSNLGFEVSFGSAQVYKKGNYSPEFDHMILFCQIGDESYLCDVGFGDHFTQPKKLVLNTPQLDYNLYFKFETDSDDHWILKKSTDNQVYHSVYRFQPIHRELIEFIPRCDYHQDNDESIFRHQKLITILTSEGRITLTDQSLKTVIKGISEEKNLLAEDEFLYHLTFYFGINSKKLFQQMFH